MLKNKSRARYLGIENKYLEILFNDSIYFVFKVKTKCKNMKLKFFPINVQIKREILITLYFCKAILNIRENVIFSNKLENFLSIGLYKTAI